MLRYWHNYFYYNKITIKITTMPVSNDNQDYGQSDKKNKSNVKEMSPEGDEKGLTSDDLKGKKVDADPEEETDKPAQQK